MKFAPDIVKPLAAAESAYVRAWAEGLDLRSAWTRFLGGEAVSDAVCRAALEDYLERLRSLARLHKRQDLVALLRRSPERIRVVDDRPSIDEFAATQGDFFSQKELLAEYAALYPEASTGVRRRERLRTRLVAAVRAASMLDGSRQPHPEDAVVMWLDDRVAQRLASAGAHILEDLMCLIANRGHWWHKSVAGLGPVKATLVVAFLVKHQERLGPLPSFALMPRAQLLSNFKPAIRFGLVPIERLAPPPDPVLSGALGLFRAPIARLTIEAANDLDAVLAWIDSCPTPATRRAYRSEGERLLLWAMLVKGKALSSLEALDEPAYVAFSASPPEQWIGPRAAQRWSEKWRPFTGPLGPSSTRRALAAARSLLSWLAGKGYLSAATWPTRP
jgi:hypothetical protein